MRPSPRDWNAVALAKLTHVLGHVAGSRVMTEILATIGKKELASAADLRTFAGALSAKEGFAGAIGGLLSLHATMYDADASASGSSEASQPSETSETSEASTSLLRSGS